MDKRKEYKIRLNKILLNLKMCIFKWVVYKEYRCRYMTCKDVRSAGSMWCYTHKCELCHRQKKYPSDSFSRYCVLHECIICGAENLYGDGLYCKYCI